MPKSDYTDDELIQALRKGGVERKSAWEFIYKKWMVVCAKVISDMGGNSDEAHDAFQEVAMPFERVICRPTFHLKTATLKTYLVTSVKRRWMKERQYQIKVSKSTVEDREIEEVVNEVEDNIQKEALRQAVDDLLKVLGERCQRILRMFAEGYSMGEIAASEKWTDAEKAKKEKYECQNKLKKHLMDHPNIKNNLKNILND